MHATIRFLTLPCQQGIRRSRKVGGQIAWAELKRGRPEDAGQCDAAVLQIARDTFGNATGPARVYSRLDQMMVS